MKAVKSLMQRLTEGNTLIVQNENGHLFKAGFEWQAPACENDIQKFEEINGILLPESFKKFLRISNGAVLYKDIQYGQWGCKLLGLDDLIRVTTETKNRGYKLEEKWLVFSTWLGDGDTLVFDLEKYNKGEHNYIIDGDQGYQVDDWDYIEGGFNKWVDRLIVAQGAKYWRWY